MVSSNLRTIQYNNSRKFQGICYENIRSHEIIGTSSYHSACNTEESCSYYKSIGGLGFRIRMTERLLTIVLIHTTTQHYTEIYKRRVENWYPDTKSRLPGKPNKFFNARTYSVHNVIMLMFVFRQQKENYYLL